MHLFQLLADPITAIFAGGGIIFLLILAVTSIFWLWMLIDCVGNASINGTEKLVWVLVILFLHFVGALIYFFVGRGSKGGTVAT